MAVVKCVCVWRGAVQSTLSSMRSLRGERVGYSAGEMDECP